MRLFALPLAAAFCLCLIVGWTANAFGAPPIRLSADSGGAADVIDAPLHSFTTVACELVLLDGRLEPGAGLRMRMGRLAPEPVFSGFLRASLVASHAWWHPALGWELEIGKGYAPVGTSSLPDSFTHVYHQTGQRHAVWARAAFEPARFQFGRLLLVAVAPRLGIPLDNAPGRRVEFGVSLLRVGWTMEGWADSRGMDEPRERRTSP